MGIKIFIYLWELFFFMRSGMKYNLLNVDKKGRLHIPMDLRKKAGIKDQVIVEKEKNLLIVRPVSKIKDPVEFLASISIKTKKTPLEMKRESEKVFEREK